MSRVVIPLLALIALPLAAQDPDRWEPAMQAFEKADRETPPAKGGLVFIGSSSIRRWDLGKSFPDLGAINRGFGGSQIEDSIRYADRILLPLEPKTIVLYAGDNDINSGKSADRVVADFEAFAAKLHGALPKTRILFIGVKPSIKRWHLIETIREANARIERLCDADERLVFIDVDAAMLGPDGKPRPELFVEDGLHLTALGYAVWTQILKPHL